MLERRMNVSLTCHTGAITHPAFLLMRTKVNKKDPLDVLMLV